MSLTYTHVSNCTVLLLFFFTISTTLLYSFPLKNNAVLPKRGSISCSASSASESDNDVVAIDFQKTTAPKTTASIIIIDDNEDDVYFVKGMAIIYLQVLYFISYENCM